VKTYTLKNGLVAQVEPIEPWVVQDHLFRHAFGVEKAAEMKEWNDEGFAELGVTQEHRDAAFAAVRKLYENGRMCGVDVVHGKPVSVVREANKQRVRPCKTCPATVLAGCVTATSTARARYLALFEELVAALAHDDAVVVGTGDFVRHSMLQFRRPAKLEGIVVGRLGLSSKKNERVFRIVRSDGLQVDLYFRGQPLTFRTLYRNKVESLRGPLQVLLKEVLPIPGEPLSERAVVSRPFWEGP